MQYMHESYYILLIRQPNDEDYEPPQWFRQQVKNDNKTIKNEGVIK